MSNNNNITQSQQFNNSKNDLNFKKKLELSYQQCLKELTNPDNWEAIVKEVKYKIDPETGFLKNEIELELGNCDEINNLPIDHSYIFKRSHFYRNNSRLKYEMETVWNKRGYYVKLFDVPSNIDPKRPIWKLKLSWKYV